MRLQTQSNHRGFTLLEAILATGIFVMAAVGLIQALNLSGIATQEAAEKADINRHLRSILTETTRKPGFQLVERTFPDRMPGIVFKTTFEEAGLSSQTGESLVGLYQVTATAIDTRKDNEEILGSVETLIYAPLYGTIILN